MELITLSEDFIKKNINEFIKINRHKVDSRMFWEESNFLYPADKKWDYSIYAFENNQIVGYVIASKKQNNIHINLIMVDSRYRKKNLGPHMINKINEVGKSNNLDSITLWAYADIQKLQAFYSNLGFELKQSRVNKNKEKLIFYSKPII